MIYITKIVKCIVLILFITFFNVSLANAIETYPIGLDGKVDKEECELGGGTFSETEINGEKVTSCHYPNEDLHCDSKGNCQTCTFKGECRDNFRVIPNASTSPVAPASVLAPTPPARPSTNIPSPAGSTPVPYPVIVESGKPKPKPALVKRKAIRTVPMNKADLVAPILKKSPVNTLQPRRIKVPAVIAPIIKGTAIVERKKAIDIKKTMNFDEADALFGKRTKIQQKKIVPRDAASGLPAGKRQHKPLMNTKPGGINEGDPDRPMVAR